MRNRWNEKEVAGLSDLELIVCASRLMGQEPDLVIVGGGNSSVKVVEPDPISGEPVTVTYVKGSGSDMRSLKLKDFAPVLTNRIAPVRNRESLSDVAMMDFGRMALQNPAAPNPSVEYLLHLFVPAKFVLHSHADLINALTDQAAGVDVDAVLESVFGPNVVSLPYIMPGFPLAKAVADVVEKNEGIDYIILKKHGLFTFAETAEAAYERHIEMVSLAEGYVNSRLNGRRIFAVAYDKTPSVEEAAKAAVNIRGALGAEPRFVVRHDSSIDILRFVNSAEAARLSVIGPATPDHVIRTKGVALYISPEDAKTRNGLEERIQEFSAKYIAYFERHKTDGLIMLDPNPRLILVPGVGAFYVGGTAKAAADVEQIWRHTVKTIEAAEAVGKFDSISEAERFTFEYWELEQRKLGRAQLPLAGKVAMVAGAYGGIGSAIARRLSKEGAAVVLVDINESVHSLEEEINRYGSAHAVVADVTNEKVVANAFNQAAITYGGLDIVVSSVGIIGKVAELKDLDAAELGRVFEINVKGPSILLKYAVQMMIEQGIGGHIINISTKNVDSPGPEFGIYSSTKAAVHQLFLVAAKEAAPHGIRVNQIATDAVFRGSGLWTPEVMTKRAARNNVPVEQLPDYYRRRNMLKVEITGEDVANAVFALETQLTKTTGAVIRVDGGLTELVGR